MTGQQGGEIPDFSLLFNRWWHSSLPVNQEKVALFLKTAGEKIAASIMQRKGSRDWLPCFLTVA